MNIHQQVRFSHVVQTQETANIDKTDNSKHKHKTHFSEKLSAVKMSVKKLFHSEQKISLPLVVISSPLAVTPDKPFTKSMSTYIEKYGADSEYVADLKSKNSVADSVNQNHIAPLFESMISGYEKGDSPLRSTTGAATPEKSSIALSKIEAQTEPDSAVSANILLTLVRSERIPHISDGIKTLSMDQPSFNNYMDNKIRRLSPEDQAVTNDLFKTFGSKIVVEDEIGQPPSKTSLKMADFVTTFCMQGIIDVEQLTADVKSLDQTQVNIVADSIRNEILGDSEEVYAGSANNWIGKGIANKLASYMLTKVP